MVTAMAAATAATIAAVAVMETMVATVMVGGTDNNQLKGAVEETMTMVMATATESTTVPCSGGSGSHVGGWGGGARQQW